MAEQCRLSLFSALFSGGFMGGDGGGGACGGQLWVVVQVLVHCHSGLGEHASHIMSLLWPLPICILFLLSLNPYYRFAYVKLWRGFASGNCLLPWASLSILILLYVSREYVLHVCFSPALLNGWIVLRID
jgi:hypothetical protein